MTEEKTGREKNAPFTPAELEEITAETGLLVSAEDMEKALGQEGIAVTAPLRLYLKEICAEPPLGEKEEASLAEAAAEGDPAAREKLVEASLRLAVTVAMRFRDRGLPFGDLIQEGSIGLMEAAEKFDPAKGYRFSTFAVWWIREAIGRAVGSAEDEQIRVPAEMERDIALIAGARRELRGENGREPSVREIALRIGMAEERVGEILDLAAEALPDGGNETAGDGVPERKSVSARQKEAFRSVQEGLRRILPSLSPREAKIVRTRFGLDGNPPSARRKVEEEFGLSPERLRQIEEKAVGLIGGGDPEEFLGNLLK